MQTPTVRRPAVAGRFYPAKPEVLARQLDEYLAVDAGAPERTEAALGCMVPHAGYMYSGQVAGAVFQRLPARAKYIILCPNHTGRGAPLAIMSKGEWLTPLGGAPIDGELAARLRQSCHLLMEDAKAHEDEHSIEVQLPFLQRQVGTFSFVPIAIGVSRYAALDALGHGIAHALQTFARPVLIIASSDMNHYEPDDVTRVKDHKAIDQILALDPTGLYEVVRKEEITMCGYGPAVAMLTAAKDLGATRAELVRYATSADTSGDRSA
ncbi:MAG: AmmeMemoRadiSam system protein B, partial [Terriglobia bacterium]